MTERELKRLTDQYWADSKGLEWYVQKLLPEELAYAEGKDHLPDNERKKCLLVLMLGFTFEPLLQVLCAYQPTQVLMVLNEKYDIELNGSLQKQSGVDYYQNNFAGAFALLQCHNLLSGRPEVWPKPMKVAGDDPVAVFQFLRQELLPRMRDAEAKRNSTRVVIDITGAKKSMIVGAYLFAAFANVAVSYVDFDIYHPKEGKPYGYTCRIAELDSPAEKFSLREWTRVKELYERYSFRDARTLLERQIIPAMKSSVAPSGKSLFDDPDTKAIDKLVKVLEFYELWNHGDHTEALSRINKEFDKATSLTWPIAIPELGKSHSWGSWPRPPQDRTLAFKDVVQQTLSLLGVLEKGSGDLKDSFYLDTESLLIYSHDEIAKVSRLIEFNKDYRSALLRAASLNEVLIKARLLFLWHKDLIEKSEAGRGEVRSALSNPRSFDTRIAELANLRKIVDLLEGKELSLQGGRSPITLTFDIIRAPANLKVSASLLENIKLLADLRNPAIHFCLYVPEIIAREAHNLAQANLSQFEQYHLHIGKSLPTRKTCRMDWDELCKACGIHFLI